MIAFVSTPVAPAVGIMLINFGAWSADGPGALVSTVGRADSAGAAATIANSNNSPLSHHPLLDFSFAPVARGIAITYRIYATFDMLMIRQFSPYHKLIAMRRAIK